MAKHTLKEILAHFSRHAEHTHEAAAQATYDLGHAQGIVDAKAEQKAAQDAAPVPQRRSGDLDEDKKDGQGEGGEAASTEGEGTEGAKT